MNRLKIILIIIVGFLSFSCGTAENSKQNNNVFNQDSLIDYPFRTLTDAFNKLGFDPLAKENSFFVVTADVHYCSPSDGMLTTVNEVNKIHPHPAFFCVAGDMICNAAHSFGAVPTPEGRQTAINEFKMFKKDADLLNDKIKLVLALGNHDTSPKEIDPEIFWEVFPGYPPYQSFNLSGVHIIVLNGHSCGYLDQKQMKWLSNDVNEISKDQTVIVVIHQPAMAQRVRERGIPKAISETFKNHQGTLWMIAGHDHRNSENIFQLQKTKLVQHGIVCGAANIWGGPERPGYWVYCLRNGKIVGRIYRKLKTGYRIEAEPDFNNAEKVPMPFDNLDNIVWRSFVGSDDEQKYLVQTDGKKCVNWLAYVNELIYRLPLKETGNNCTKFAILCEYTATKDQIYQNGQYFLSLDNENWEEIELENAEFETLSFVIPQDLLQSENLYFKFTPIGGEAHIGGFALIR